MAAAFGLFAIERSTGSSIEVARTAAVTTFVMIEVAYLFNCRSLRQPLAAIGVFSNRWIWIGSAAMIASQLVIVYAPVAQTLFGTAAIDAASWARIIAAAIGVHILVALEARWRCSPQTQPASS